MFCFATCAAFESWRGKENLRKSCLFAETTGDSRGEEAFEAQALGKARTCFLMAVQKGCNPREERQEMGAALIDGEHKKRPASSLP